MRFSRYLLGRLAAGAFGLLLAALLLWMAIALRIDQLVADGAPASAWRGELFRVYSLAVLGLAVAAAAVAVPVLRRRKAARDRITQWATRVSEGAVATPPPLLPGGGNWARLSRRLGRAHQRLLDHIDALERERSHGDSVLRHMAEGVMAVDRSQRILLINPAAQRLLQFGRGNLIGRPLVDVIRVPEIHRAVEDVLDGRGLLELGVETPGEMRRFLRVQVAPLPGEPAAGAVLSLHDQTPMRRLETLRREFVANVSHELKTPLAAIKGYAETLQLGALEDPEQARRFVDQIASQSDRLEALIADMLQLARVQAGQHILAVGLVPLESVVRESVNAYLPVAKKRRQEVHIDAVPPDCTVWADREALLTIVNNLVGNAVRYTHDSGQIEVTVRPAGEFWQLTVRDTGIGIPAADLERIFERFYRVEKARDQRHGGTGLGLSIVKNLVQALHGRVQVESEPGRGSRFHVWLPRGDLPCPSSGIADASS